MYFQKRITISFRKLFLDKNGHLVVSQWPNWPLLTWIACTILTKILKSGFDYTVLSWAAAVALAYWSFLEIFKGVNYLRRAMGFAVLVYIIFSRVT